MYSVLGNHRTMTHRYIVNVIHVYRGNIVFTQQVYNNLTELRTLKILHNLVRYYVSISGQILRQHVSSDNPSTCRFRNFIRFRNIMLDSV